MDGFLAEIEVGLKIVGQDSGAYMPMRYLVSDSFKGLIDELKQYWYTTKGYSKADVNYDTYKENLHAERELDDRLVITLFCCGQKGRLGNWIINLYFPEVQQDFDQDFMDLLDLVLEEITPDEPLD